LNGSRQGGDPDDSDYLNGEGAISDMIVAMESEQEEEPNVQNELVDRNMELLDEEEDDDDVIDIDNPEDLARRGLKRIQIEGEQEEYLLDGEGNIYNL
jgi:hypothetical protein